MYPIWETGFLSYPNTQNQDVYTAILPKGVADDHKDFVQHNHSAYAELAQVLDERSLQLIMTDVPQDGRGALALLRKHYQSTEKPRVLSLYEELTTLRMRDTEDVTDYLIPAYTAVTGLRSEVLFSYEKKGVERIVALLQPILGRIMKDNNDEYNVYKR